MIDLGRRAKRLSRILTIENRKLEAYVASLAGIDSRRADFQQNYDEAVREINDLSVHPHAASAEPLRIGLSWSMHLQERCNSIQLQINELDRDRALIVDQICQQRTAIKGWERLLKTIHEKMRSRRQIREAAQSDDDYLVRRGTA